MKQTAVEWLIQEFTENYGYMPNELIEKAKEMEKEQHEITWSAGLFCETVDKQAFIEYYNQTFKSE